MSRLSSPKDEAVSFVPEQSIREQIQDRFQQVQQRLQSLIGDVEIHHIGSTAIPNALTKGDLDVQIRIERSRYEQAKDVLMAAFSVNEGAFSGDDGISFEDYSEDVPAGVHLTVIDGACDLQSKFRDRLLASAALQREYDDLKRSFEGGSMAEYRDAKEAFVLRVMPEFAE